MFRSLFLAAALMAFTPLAANAGEITLLPSIKLQIGDRDHYGNYWDGGHWRIMATTVAGISVKRMSVAIVKAGAIVTIIAEKAGVMGTAIKRVRQWSTMPDATLVRLIRPTNRLFNA